MRVELRSSALILRWVAYPIEPFCFELVQRELPPSLLKSEGERLWQQPGLFDQVSDCQADKLNLINNQKSDRRVHLFPFSLNCAAGFYSSVNSASNAFWMSEARACVFLAVHSVQIA